MTRVYLAGPDVFLPDPRAWLGRKQAICGGHGLVAVSPLDNVAEEPAGWARLPEWRRIALRNEAHIRSCAAVIANLTPFRGASADAGTVYEVGFARGLGLPVFGYAATRSGLLARTLRLDPSARAGAGGWRDAEGLQIESFGLYDNLMIDAALADTGGPVLVEAADRWRDLAAFEAAVTRARAALRNEARAG